MFRLIGWRCAQARRKDEKEAGSSSSSSGPSGQGPSSPRRTVLRGSSHSSSFLRKKPAETAAVPEQLAAGVSSAGPDKQARPVLDDPLLLVDKMTHEFKVLEISVFQAVNLEDLQGKVVRLETSAGSLWRFATKKSPVSEEGSAQLAEEVRVVGDKRALAARKSGTPLMAQLVSTDAKARGEGTVSVWLFQFFFFFAHRDATISSAS